MAIPNVTANSLGCASRSTSFISISAQVFLLVLSFVISVQAVDWSAPEQDLARKIVALTGGAAVSLSFQNRSSMGRRDAEVIQNGLRNTLAAMGARFAQTDPGAAMVAITLSENPSAYVWVAEIRKAGGDNAVVMVTVPRLGNAIAGRETVPLSLRKVLLWSQAEQILDVAVLEENSGPNRIAVLSAGKVSIYRLRGASPQPEGVAEIPHSKPWPRDLRGRIVASIVPSKDHSLDVYLPGVTCRSAAGASFTLNCHEGNDPWPLGIADASGTSTASPVTVNAFLDASRDFFTSVVAGDGLKTVPQFYSAAVLPRDKNPVWLFAAVDREIHIFDGATDRVAKLRWGSDLAGVRTSCGAGWQVLATAPVEEGADSVRAYEIPESDPVAVSAALDFPGPLSALWTEARGDTAIAIAKNAETGNYEAFRVAVACGQ